MTIIDTTKLAELLQNSMPQTILALAVIIAAAALNCFWGYRFFRISLTVQGFMIGLLAGKQFLDDRGFTSLVSWGIALLLGALLAFLAYRLYLIGLFLSCFATAGLLTLMIANVRGAEHAGWIALAAGVLFGLIACLLNKPLLILITAVQGGVTLGTLAVSSIQLMTGNTLQAAGPILAVLVSVVLIVLGVILQHRLKKKAPAGK